MPDVAISAERLSKRYRIGLAERRHETLTGALKSAIASPLSNLQKLRRLDASRVAGDGHASESAEDLIWALRDVSFEVDRGEVLGIIGRNGAGKSTLLKILSRIAEPTVGRVRMRGSVSSLLEVGTGFHPELTGRENVYLNGTILGMTKREIDRKFDQIVDFSGVSKFLDTPVKRFSSGMKVRLAFAVAAHLEPDILIVDEVLAVGDAEFQRKCIGRMRSISEGEGRTILFVSHNMHAILNICSRAILLESGRLVLDDEPSRVARHYQRDDDEQIDTFRPDLARRSGDGRASVVEFCLEGPAPSTGGPAAFAMEIERPPGESRPLAIEAAVDFVTEDGARALQLFSKHMGREFDLPPGRSRVVVGVDSLPLVPGRYRLNLWVGSAYSAIDYLEGCYTMTVAPGCFHGDAFVENRGIPVAIPSDWHAEGTVDLVKPGAANPR